MRLAAFRQTHGAVFPRWPTRRAPGDDPPEYRRVRGKQPHGLPKKAANRIVGPYRIPNVKIDCLAVYTNTVPASSYRGFGRRAGNVSRENLKSIELAEMAGCDSVEFRLKNLAQCRERFIQGCVPSTRTCPATFARRPACCGWIARSHRGTGAPCVALQSDAGAHPVTLAMVQVYADGSVSVLKAAARRSARAATPS